MSKIAPNWDEYDINEIGYSGAGCYRYNSWERWPDLQNAFPFEVRSAIKLWCEHGYEPMQKWVDFLVGKENEKL